MNRIICNMIHKLVFNAKRVYTIEDLSETFQVSTRMIYNYSKEILLYFSNNGLGDRIVFKDSSICFIGNEAEALELLKKLSSLSLYEYRADSDERLYLLTIILITEPSIKLETIEKMMYVSRSTLSNDIKRIKDTLNSANISFNESRSRGIVISASEIQKRDLLYYCILKLCNENIIQFEELTGSPIVSYARKLIKIDKYHARVKQIISNAEEKRGIVMPDRDFYELTTNICIMINRIEQGFNIYFSSSPVANQNIQTFCNELSLQLEKLVDINMHEFHYLCLLVSGYHYISDGSDNSIYPLNFHVLVKNLLYNLSSYYGVPLTNDDILHEYLTAHLSACYQRNINGEELNNPFKDDIIKKYRDDFLFLKNNTGILQEYFNKNISDNELTYILMHILAAIERVRIPKFLIRVLVVSNVSLANAEMLALVIKERVNVSIVASMMVHSFYNERDRLEYDLTISTIPLSSGDSPCIVVNPLLDDSDYANIERAVNSIKNVNASFYKSEGSNSERDSKNHYVSDYLNDSTVLLDKSVNDWKEAIIAAGEPLLWNNAITANYQNQMVSQIIRYGPYNVFSDGIALAHASFNDGVLNTGFSFLRLKNEVDFGNDTPKVRIIFAFAIHDDQTEISMLLNLMNALTQPMFYKKLLAAETKEEVIEIVRQYENYNMGIQDE